MIIKKLIFFLLFFLFKNGNAQLNGDSEIIKNVQLLWEHALKNNSNIKIVQLKTTQLMVDYSVSQAYKYPQIIGNDTLLFNLLNNRNEIETFSKQNYTEVGIEKSILALTHNLKMEQYKNQYIKAGFYPTFFFNRICRVPTF